MSTAFDGGLISSDGGLVLLRESERGLRLAETLAGCIRGRRNQAKVVHSLSAMLRFRMMAIACGYEDTDDCDALRAYPLFKLDLREWIPEDDLAHFVIEAVECVDMGAFKVNYRCRGLAQYHPWMMLALLIYCYANLTVFVSESYLRRP